ncbi:purine-cytosine permease family protein [Leucobacter massiliensis]|uniref:Allantoin permease n=1 Tax=Leucobacter massiliensis TaxID=1686285 RepID=A0A2S9QM93_9MICO|nr:allantoin permease [Leucobacter massiliensis]PRI10710.1 allantoin permease [Leucobacter massiliensis]
MSLRDAFRSPATSLDDQMESYATSRVPHAQRWPAFAILLILTGNVTAMFWFTLGGQIGFLVGWPGMLLPIGYLVVVSTILGALIMRIASKEGLSLVLLTRGLGFGAKGSAVASFVYGINYIFYFIFEGSIVSHALSQYFGIGQGSAVASVIFALVGAAALFFAWRGMHSMNILQRFGMPIFIGLFIVGMLMLADGHALVGPGQWESLSPGDPTVMAQAFSLANGQIVFQALLATDYGRFSRPQIGYRGTAAIMFGELVMIAVVMILGSLLAFTLYPTLSQENPQLWATDPGFVFALVMGFLGVVFTIITQIRINVMNLYSGSLAFANTWDAFAKRPIRRTHWMVGLLVLGILLYPVNVLQYTDTFLAVTGIMTNTWIFILLADYFVCRRLLRFASTDRIEYEDHEVRQWNPCGMIAMAVAVLVGALGLFGVYPVYYASFAAMLIGPIIHVTLTAATRGRFYAVAPVPVAA